MLLHLTRKSVCMGDDVMAPNAGTLELAADSPLPAVLERLLAAHYLAAVSGGATWSVWSHGRLLATLHEPERGLPRTLLAAGSEALVARELDPVYFDYHCAADPAEVLRNPQLRR